MGEAELIKTEESMPIPNSHKNLGDSLKDFFTKFADVSEPKDKILTDMSHMLFDEEKLLMIARLDKNLAFYIVKHYIILIYFYRYYNVSKVIIKTEESDEYPFYKIKPEYNYPEHNVLIESYEEFIKKLLQITISFDGGGREDIKQIIEALFREKEKEEERGFRGLMKKYL